MIYTVTLNPALDYVIAMKSFAAGRINRNETEHIFCGGKGVNVSLILNELETESVALGFTAGFTGVSLEEGLRRSGITTDFVHVSQGMTRINVKIHAEQETEINGTGPLITENDFQILIAKLKRLGEGDILVLSGSIPSCMESDAYERILRAVDPEVQCVVDAEKHLLQKALAYHPFLIKPNHMELGELFGTVLNSEAEIVECGRKLQESGARNVLISMAKDGAILLDEASHVYRIKAVKGTAVNSVGAGDSMVAGFLAGYLRKGSYEYALRLGTACGGATAFRSGLADRTAIEETLALTAMPESLA